MDYCNGNIVSNNVLTGNGAGRGIEMGASNGNTVAGNTLSLFLYGLVIADCADSVCTANTFTNIESIGILLYSTDEDSIYSCNIFMFNTLDDTCDGLYIDAAETNAALVVFKYNNIINNEAFGVRNRASNELDATHNYWSGNLADTEGTVDTGSRLADAVTNTMPIPSVVTTTTTTSTTTSTSTTTATTTTTAVVTDTVTETTSQAQVGPQVVTLIETSTSTTTETDTVTLLNPTTLTETQSFTLTNTQTSTTTQQLTSTNTQSLTLTLSVTVPQTVNQTSTTTLTVMEETLDWPLIIVISVVGLLAGGLIVTIVIRKI
jgi:parallel beta-helix repeat protein